MAKTTRKNVVDSGYSFEHNPTEHLQPPRLEPHGFGSKNKIDTFKFQFVVVRDGRHLTVGPYAQTTSNLCAVRIERKPARIGPTTLGFSAIIAAAESVGHVIGPSCWGGGERFRADDGTRCLVGENGTKRERDRVGRRVPPGRRRTVLTERKQTVRAEAGIHVVPVIGRRSTDEPAEKQTKAGIPRRRRRVDTREVRARP